MKNFFMKEDPVVNKHTIVPLYDFGSTLSGDLDLGEGCFITKLPKNIFDNFLHYGRLWDGSGKTKVIDSLEKGRFTTTFCVDHRYRGPESPHLSEPEAESKKKVRKIVLGIQLLKVVMTAPEFIIHTQGEDYRVVDALKTNERAFLTETESVSPELFSTDDIEKLKVLWLRICNIYDRDGGKFNRITNALEFFRVGLSMLAWQLRFAMFIIALESIYSTSNVEVTYSLSQRLAWFLGKNYAERLAYFEKAKKCYRIRSQIVHGDTVHGDLRKEVDGLMVDLEKMARSTLLKILLDDQLVDVFLDNNKLKDYFSALTLHEVEK